MNKKITESEMLSRFKVGEVLLDPLVVRQVTITAGSRKADALIELALPGEVEGFSFAIESKCRSTPEAIHSAMSQVKSFLSAGELPMIQVPYLSPDRLEELHNAQISGVDLCGNGVVIIPGRLYVIRSGQPNQYRDSRPLSNPYSGRSAMVARMMIMQPEWESLTSLALAIRDAGIHLSLSQISKAVQAMAEDLILRKNKARIVLKEPLRLLDQLSLGWRKSTIVRRLALRIPSPDEWPRALSSGNNLRWAVTGESSVMQYTLFVQGGPTRIAVSDLSLAQMLLRGAPERVRSFANIELLETQEDGFFLANYVDKNGIRWANRLQTWLELQNGDARQQDAANELRDQLLRNLKQ